MNGCKATSTKYIKTMKMWLVKGIRGLAFRENLMYIMITVQ